LRCWLISGTHCRDEIQGSFVHKVEACVQCKVFQQNALADPAAQGDTLKFLISQFGAHAEQIEAQREAIRELSTPVIKVWDKVLIVPLIGILDSQRAQLVMETLLQKIDNTQSRVVIIDILGIPVIDTLVANHLIRTVTAARVLGAECIVTGIRPKIAQILVQLGVDLSTIATRSSMSDGMAMAFEILNLKVVSK
jgi:anti-anti-sigma regulatory factor